LTDIYSFTVAATKLQSDRIFVSVGIVGLSHVRARQCTKRHGACKMVKFLDHTTSDFMSLCCSVL